MNKILRYSCASQLSHFVFREIEERVFIMSAFVVPKTQTMSLICVDTCDCEARIHYEVLNEIRVVVICQLNDSDVHFYYGGISLKFIDTL